MGRYKRNAKRENAQGDEAAEVTPADQSKKSKQPKAPPEPLVAVNGHMIKQRFAEHLVRTPVSVVVTKGFVDGMLSDAEVFCNDDLYDLLLEELAAEHPNGFLSCVQQVANVATIPTVVRSLAMPDAHSGYGFSIGGVAAFRMDDPRAVICPGGVGFDINCGVRLIRTTLRAEELLPVKERLADLLQAGVPNGVGTKAKRALTLDELDAVMRTGMRWLVANGLADADDLHYVEEGGCIENAEPAFVSQKAKGRGMHQLGTLGSGNHYLEVQVVDEVFDAAVADALGLARGTVCVMVHCGSRGLGHQVCQDFLDAFQGQCDVPSAADPQLNAVTFASETGQRYFRAMNAAANFAFANRGMITHAVRAAFEAVFGRPWKEMGMSVVYDVCHNIAKVEEQLVDGKLVPCVMHRKGATRALPPHHPQTPAAYQEIGQPAIIGGSMGTCSHVIVGTEEGMRRSFGSTCHGAGRRLSRVKAMKTVKSEDVIAELTQRGIVLRISDPKLAGEEADAAYKDVNDVVQTCHDAGISKMVVKLVPQIVVKG